MDETTQLGTIWSNTLMDILCTAIKQGKEPEALGVLREMKQKRYSKDQIRKYATKNLEARDVATLERLLKAVDRK